MKKKTITTTLAALAIFMLCSGVTEAGLFGHRCCSSHSYCKVVKTSVTVLEKANCFKFASSLDFTVAPGTSDLALGNCDQFRIKLIGKEADLALFGGEKVKLSAVCCVQLPQEYIDGLHQAGSGLTLLKPLVVSLESVIDSEGYAVFDRAAVVSAVAQDLKKIRFWDHPAIFGLEKLNIKITGSAKVGERIFKSTNALQFKGDTDEIAPTPAK